MSIRLVEGDITPVIMVQVSEPGKSVDISQDTIKVHTRLAGTTTPLRTLDGEVVGSDRVKIALPTGFTDQVGKFEAEVEIVGKQTIFNTFTFEVRKRY